jgi:glycosyltransferase involved in cell wall biosynthesis
MRVWLACDWFVKYTADLARGLADLGCDVVLLTRDHDQEFGGEPGAMREFVERVLDGEARHLELKGRVRDPAGPGAVARLWRARGRWSPDVVHVQESIENDPRLILASGLLTGRFALTVHDPVLHPGDAVPTRSARLLQHVLRRRADLAFVHSRQLADEAMAEGVRAPIEVVPHGVGESLAAPLPERESLLFFGRISHYKGLDVLLDAMPLVWRRQPELTLVVAGEGETPGHEVLADPRIELRLGHVPEGDLPGLFAASTCVVLPYRQASQSGVGSLAKQHGRAIIATRTGGLSELVQDGWGRLVPSEDPKALADAIMEVVGTPGLARKMGENAAATSGAASWRAVAAQTVAAYRRHLL